MRIKLFPVLLIILALFFSACEKPKKGKVEAPDILFVSGVHDFGVLDEGESVSHVFEFSNSGSATLVIEDVRPTCGCTITGGFDKQLEPGETGSLLVTFDSSGFDGPVSKPMIVRTNVPGKEELILTISGTVKVAVRINPKSLFLGNISQDRSEALSGAVSITNRLAKPFRIIDVIRPAEASQRPNVTFAGDGVETRVVTNNKGFDYSLLITIFPPFKYGDVTGSLIVQTDIPSKPEIVLDFSYHVDPLVKIFPNPLFVSSEQINKAIDQIINVQCAAGYDLELLDYRTNKAEVKIGVVEVEQGRRYKLVLSFPKNFSFDSNNTLNVEFKAGNLPDEPIFSVPVLKM
ncbi:MAG: DUF1573 domain-containing protein [Spirochaetales bacterium]|nr:DUF1573 domain-containing protein [Spirochaetales bacterium]